MKDKGFFQMEMAPLVLFSTILCTPTIPMALVLYRNKTIPMIIEGDSTKHIYDYPHLQLATNFMSPPLDTPSSSFYLSFIVICIFYLGKHWKTKKHAIPIYMLLK